VLRGNSDDTHTLYKATSSHKLQNSLGTEFMTHETIQFLRTYI